MVDTDRDEFSYHDFESEISSDDYESDSDYEDALDEERKETFRYLDGKSKVAYAYAPFKFEGTPLSSFNPRVDYDIVTDQKQLATLVASLRPKLRRFTNTR